MLKLILLIIYGKGCSKLKKSKILIKLIYFLFFSIFIIYITYIIIFNILNIKYIETFITSPKN